jgi:hypothetical protein
MVIASAGLYNATVAVNGLLRNSSAANPHVRGWVKPGSWFINNTNWLRVTNPEAGPLSIGIVVNKSKGYGPIVNSGVISGTETVIATGINNQTLWCITDIGSSRWVGTAGLPNVR